MQKTFLYPGQGAQYPGMGLDLWEHSQAVRKLFSTASKIAGFDVKEILAQGSPEELQRTDRSQVLITAASLAAYLFLHERDIISDAVAGFSLGEYAAMVDAGVLTMEDAFHTVKQRGEIMERVSRRLDSSEGDAGMIAVIGLSAEKVTATIASVPHAYPAIYNSPQQTVVSATFSALTEATELLKEAGAKRVIRLRVSGPFHCPLMKEASEQFARYLEPISFTDPKKIIYSNVTGKQVHTGSDLKTLCVQQLVSPVQWTHTEQSLVQDGTRQLYEAGPGKVLRNLWKSFADSDELKGLEVLSAGTVEGINDLRI